MQCSNYLEKLGFSFLSESIQIQNNITTKVKKKYLKLTCKHYRHVMQAYVSVINVEKFINNIKLKIIIMNAETKAATTLPK